MFFYIIIKLKSLYVHGRSPSYTDLLQAVILFIWGNTTEPQH